VTQRDERIAVPPRDRRVGDGERRGLDPPAVVTLDDLFCDVAGNVGDELLTRRGEFGEIVGERADETTQREGAIFRCADWNSPAAKSKRSESA
jgi:hypothetical protein